jgi:DNA-binding CsgD family transcriptional regulator
VDEVQKAQRVVPVPTLRFGSGSLEGVRIRLDQEVATLGRGNDNGYVVPDPRVSRVHAELHLRSGTLFVTDLGSAGGTSVNGTEIDGPTIVRHADSVSFGAVTATLEDPAADPGGDATMVFAVPAVQSGPHLSPRQQEVLERIAEGMTNAEIGEQLGISERTVKAYAQELYDKLGVRNRAGAVAEAIKEGLLYGGR